MELLQPRALRSKIAIFTMSSPSRLTIRVHEPWDLEGVMVTGLHRDDLLNIHMKSLESAMNIYMKPLGSAMNMREGEKGKLWGYHKICLWYGKDRCMILAHGYTLAVVCTVL